MVNRLIFTRCHAFQQLNADTPVGMGTANTSGPQTAEMQMLTLSHTNIHCRLQLEQRHLGTSVCKQAREGPAHSHNLVVTIAT